MEVYIFIFIHGLCIRWSYGLIEYTNDCGLLSVTEPAIDGRYVVFRFTPYSHGEGEVKAVWRYTKSGWAWDRDVLNTSRHYFVSNSTTYTFMMYWKCYAQHDVGQKYWMVFTTSTGGSECTSERITINVTDVPPQSVTFLNTTDIDGCHGCLSGKYYSLGHVNCYVKGGTLPVTVTISIPGEDVEETCDLSEENSVCKKKLRFYNKYHLKDIRCEASNKATDAPLTTTTRLYVIMKPTDPALDAPRQYEGDVNMSCSSYGDQPTPELSLLINGSHVTNITDVHLADGRIIRLGYLRREWNGAKITCCMRHPYYMDQKCSTKRVSYYFSPESINVTQLSSHTTDKVHFLQTFQCVISNANPACRAVWSYPDGIGLPVGTKETNETTGQRRETTLSTLPLNVTRKVNGEEMRCRAVCEAFNGTHIWATHSICVPCTKQQQHLTMNPKLIWSIAGLGAILMLVLLVMVAVIVRKRRARNGKIPATETISLDGIKRKSVKGDDRGNESSSQCNAPGISLDLDEHKDVYYNIERNVYDDLQQTNVEAHDYGSLQTEIATETFSLDGIKRKSVKGNDHGNESSSQCNVSGINMDLDEHKDVYYNIERNVYDDLQETNVETHDYGSLQTEIENDTNVQTDKAYENIELHYQTLS